MSEEATTSAPETTQDAPTGGQEITWENSPIAQVYNPDGSPKAEAATALAEMGHEEIAGFTLRNGQDLFTALKSGKDNQTAAKAKVEGMVKIPGEDATAEDRAAFNKSLGALESAEDYMAGMWPDQLPEGFQKDEKLAGVFADYAAKHPVNTAESVKELVSSVIAAQIEQQETLSGEYRQKAKEAAQKTADALAVEMGGTAAFEKFSDDMKDMVTSQEFTDLGFEFVRNEDKTVGSENPLHAAMLSDPAILRLFKERLGETKAASLPSGAPQSESSASKAEQASAIYQKHGVGGWKSTKHYEEYKSLLGITKS